MSNLVLYKAERQGLSGVGFVKDTQTQIKIRDINNSYELGRQLMIILMEAYDRLGIKGSIHTEDAKDIKDLILSNFKGMSLDEIAYAFKLERHGLTWEKTQHFQLFNAEYVGAVLKKYGEWKQKVRVEHNISNQPKELTFSESEKQRLTSNAIRKCLDAFLDTLTIPKDYVFVYDELASQGFLNQSKEFKKEIYNDAIELLETELTEKKASSKDEHTEIRHILENLREPKQPQVILKCKELSITSFFRLLRADEKKLKEFQEQYQIKE